MNKWLTYQKERFPVLSYGLLVAAFAYSGLSLSSMLRGADSLPDFKAIAVAFTATLLLFWQLRVADEFKDFEDDSKFQPDRPVQRGLVTLSELGWTAAFAAAIQLAVTAWLSPILVLPLLCTWGYFALMSREFFVREWLRKHPFTYLWSHMLILVCTDIYITACDWLVAGDAPPRGLILFLAASFFNGIVIEVGRKMRAPSDEKVGVETYTSTWGIPTSVFIWLGAIALSATFIVLTAAQLGFAAPILIAIAVLFACAAIMSIKFLKAPVSSRAKRIQTFSNIWTLLMYLAVGAVPALARAL